MIIAAKNRVEPHHVPDDLGLDLTAPPAPQVDRDHQQLSENHNMPPASRMRSLPSEGIELRQLLADIESDYIDQALERTDGNRNQAARLLGLNRTTLVEKLRKRSES